MGDADEDVVPSSDRLTGIIRHGRHLAFSTATRHIREEITPIQGIGGLATRQAPVGFNCKGNLHLALGRKQFLILIELEGEALPPL